MFSLIITIISIALVAALALATLYYGGTAFNKGSANADAAKLINEGQQVNGAMALYRADVGSSAVTALDGTTGKIKELVTAFTQPYLSQVPAGLDGETLISAGQVANVGVVSNEVCSAIEVKAGRSATVSTTAQPAGVFGCWADAGVNKFFYKF